MVMVLGIFILLIKSFTTKPEHHCSETEQYKQAQQFAIDEAETESCTLSVAIRACNISDRIVQVSTLAHNLQYKILTTLEGSFWNSSLMSRPEGFVATAIASRSCSRISFR